MGYFLAEKSRFFHVYWLLPGLAVSYLFHVYLVHRFGGTPGKLLLKTRIALVDGSRVTWKAAALRHAVLFVLTALVSVSVVMGTLAMTDEQYLGMDHLPRSQMIVSLAPSWHWPVLVLLQVWIWGEFVTMLFNKKRRAVHDYLAGTVVLRTDTR